MEFIIEAHNGISARIAEEAGFKGIWASGLALSAQFGVRDSNEASWTQIVDMLEFMSDASNIPILLDGDTGYGNFNNMRRLVKKLEQRGIAGVCIEDKLFPKSNSFLEGTRQPLADREEFCGKIKAGKDSQSHPDFCIVARTEAFIAGGTLAEALSRAESYRLAGADAILVHSKLSNPKQIVDFSREWAGRCPLVIVPTKYYSTPTEVFRKAQISLVIWANHLIRAAVAAMQEVAEEIHRSQTLIDTEDRIAGVDELFRLQGADELLAAEKRYFGTARTQTRAILLAASRGSELETLTQDRPKVMLPVGGKPLLRRLLDRFKTHSIDDVTLVAGYKSEAIDIKGVKITINPDYETTGELASLYRAKSAFQNDMLVAYGDLLFRNYILKDLLAHPGEIVTVVDSAPPSMPGNGMPDYAYCSSPDDRSMFGQDINLLHISNDKETNFGKASGRWVGMLRFQGAGEKWLSEALEALKKEPDFNHMGIPQLCNYLVKQGRTIKVLYIHGHWLDVNALDDLDRTGDFIS